MNADPEGVVHHVIGVGQVATDPIVDTDHVGLAGQVAGKQQTGADLVLVQVGEQVQPRYRAVLFQSDWKAEPRGVGVFGRLGQVHEFFAVLQTFFQEGIVVFAGLDELRGLVQLGQSTGCLHIGDFKVVAQVAVGVFVVVAIRQVTQLLAKAFAAGVVFAGLAKAIAAPVAKALGDGFEFVVVSKDRTAFTHGDVVGRVKAQCGNVPKGANHLAAVGGTQRIAAVFYQPQVVFFAQGGDHIQVERVAQAVRQHDGFGFGADGRFDLAGVDVVGKAVDIHKDRHGAKLEDGVDGGGEACCYADDFIARLDGPVPQFWRGECAERDQVGRRAGIDGDQVLDADKGRELLLEFGIEAARGEPAVKRGFNHVLEFGGVEQLAGRWNHGGAGQEWIWGQGDGGVLFDQFGDLVADGLGFGVLHRLKFT